MKYSLLLLSLILGLSIWFYPQISNSNGSGSPGGKTGSPGDGGSCQDCHYTGTNNGGTISTNIDNEFNLYNNICLGYYNENLKWLYSSSNFIEISLHKIKYSNFSSKWINCSYKSRYKYKNFISGYDVNYYFWKNIKNNFLSFIIGYTMKKKITIELKTHWINNIFYFNSFNFSISL